MFTVIAFIVYVLTACYSFLTSEYILGIVERLRRLRRVAADKPPPGMLNATFKLRINRTWLFFAALSVVGPYLGMFFLTSYYLSKQTFLLTESFEAMKGLGTVTVAGHSVQGSFATVSVETELVAIFMMAAFLDGKDVLRVRG